MRYKLLLLLMIPTICWATPKSNALRSTRRALNKLYRPEIKRLEKRAKAAAKKAGLNPKLVGNGILVLNSLIKQKVKSRISLGNGKSLISTYSLPQKEGMITFKVSF